MSKEADLSGANLQEADLSGAKLQKADLSGANLQKADLGAANLQEADLSGAKLQEAHLSWANLQKAVMAGTESLTTLQVKNARNWELAFYDDDFLGELGLPPDPNERVKKKLAELEMKKKEAATKK